MSLVFGATAQTINLPTAKFKVGDSKEWSKPDFNDSDWRTIDVSKLWDSQGVPADTHYGWYRFHLKPTKEMLKNSDLKEYLVFNLGTIDDVDEAYLNGVLIGKTGVMPGDKGTYKLVFDVPRQYTVKANDKNIRWDEDNVLAVRCYSGNAPGGMFGGNVNVQVPNRIDGGSISFAPATPAKGADENTYAYTISLNNSFPATLSGTLKVNVVDSETGKEVSSMTKKVSATQKKPATLTMNYDKNEQLNVNVTFTEPKTGKSISASYSPKYILTPKAPETPRFNTPTVYGVRPGSPIHFRFGVTGNRPMTISSADLPAGLSINPENGALSGSLKNRGDYTFTVTAKNDKGTASQKFTIKVGDKIALTPPMGWNSWNCWGLSVSQDKVISSAKALIDKGLADYGYAYMNIDDGWEAPTRNADGTIAVNEKFPDMKGLGDWLHNEGLKFGIYSSPGDLTCGGYLGSIDHEKQDAESYNDWGIDYLKYDWCGYGRKHATEADRGTVASYVRPYLLMEGFLREQPRDIFYSLCQYGMADVWKWGEFVDANSWRTTGDITDTWESMYNIGFVSQADLWPYAKPGSWNDPDMLIVGKVGWSNNLRDSRLTPDEQYTHISLWTLLAADMLIGCDLAQLDEFTINLLCNNEVNAVNQDVLGKQAKRDIVDGDIQIWSRPLSDGSRAIGIFNVGKEGKTVDFNSYKNELGIKNPKVIRDLWRQKNLSTTDTKYFIPTHGVKYIKVTE